MGIVLQELIIVPSCCNQIIYKCIMEKVIYNSVLIEKAGDAEGKALIPSRGLLNGGKGVTAFSTKVYVKHVSMGQQGAFHKIVRI